MTIHVLRVPSGSTEERALFLTSPLTSLSPEDPAFRSEKPLSVLGDLVWVSPSTDCSALLWKLRGKKRKVSVASLLLGQLFVGSLRIVFT